PERILQTDLKDISEAIRPAGYFNVKAIRLKHLATWWVEKAGWAADPTSPVEEIRKALLEVKGVGPETADSILLYAWGKPIFVVDAYTRRILARHRLIQPDASYAEIQETMMAALPEDVNVFNEYHALLVRLAKEYCRTSPQCQGCPLAPPPA
ncbi:MAG: endonuclease, partial [Lentisphaerae bacterium]